MKMKTFNRRDFLKFAGWTTLGSVSACAQLVPPVTPTLLPSDTPEPSRTARPVETPLPGTNKKRVLRIAHMTDFHMGPDEPALSGMRLALRHAQMQEDPPDIIFNTGDCVYDSLEMDKSLTEKQWEVYTSILASENKLPIIYAIGNHDVWGWGLSDPEAKNDPLYGKQMALEKLGIPDRYYSFDRAGWHFVVLDSNHLPNQVSSEPYIGKLDDEQFEWLTADVNGVTANSNVPVCIVSHIPILAACEYFDGPNEMSGNWVVPGAWMHIDARRLRTYFLQMPNVRLCLSGHTHQYESLDYLGVRYITGGAICGNWWDGSYLDFPPAYVLVNLYDDGTADSQFVPYNEA